LSLPLSASAVLCTQAQYQKACCVGDGPFGQQGQPPTWQTSKSTNNGAWSWGSDFVRYEFANDCAICGKNQAGCESKTQKGQAWYSMVNQKEKKVEISMSGVAEAKYERYIMYVDGAQISYVQAANQWGTCWVSSCNMCNVAMPKKVFTLSTGPHEIKFDVSSIDHLFHKNCYFQISYWEEGCLGCECTAAPTQSPTAPTKVPTTSPTPSPTKAPTLEKPTPTPHPTPFPTKNPTTSPTPSPTPNPTWNPTPPPTPSGACTFVPPGDCKCKANQGVWNGVPTQARPYCDIHTPQMTNMFQNAYFCFVEETVPPCGMGQSFNAKSFNDAPVAPCVLPSTCQWTVPDDCNCKATSELIFGTNITATATCAKHLFDLRFAENPYKYVDFCFVDKDCSASYVDPAIGVPIVRCTGEEIPASAVHLAPGVLVALMIGLMGW